MVFGEDLRGHARGDLASDGQVRDLTFQTAGLPAGGDQDVGVENDAH